MPGRGGVAVMVEEVGGCGVDRGMLRWWVWAR